MLGGGDGRSDYGPIVGGSGRGRCDSSPLGRLSHSCKFLRSVFDQLDGLVDILVGEC